LSPSSTASLQLYTLHLSTSLSLHTLHAPHPSKMAPRTGGSQWDHKSDKDMLLAIIDSGALKGIDWKTIADRMTVKGYTFTHEACRYVSPFHSLILSSIILSHLCPQSSLYATSPLRYSFISRTHFHPTNASLANISKRSARNLALALPTRPNPLPASLAPVAPPLKSARVLIWRMAPLLTTTRT
jgi:hypothetical protein